ncbi:MAG: hypothetical protein NTW29_10670 [Bacteroidetes bacterium]|nr:hypothetical protein [Bacteroidota bacterium]
MKKNIVIVVFLIALPTINCVAQGGLSQYNLSIQKTIFANAISIQDAATALQACHNIVAIQGESSPYKDTMAILYYRLGSYNQCILLGLKLLKAKPSNTSLLAIVANSYSKLDVIQEAIYYQEKLYQQQPVAANGFNLMEMQFQLERYAELLSTAKKVMANKIDSNLVYYYKDSANRQLQTPLKAAIYNMVGMAYYNMGKKGDAANFFKEALLLDDKFLFAITNAAIVVKEDQK